MTRALRSFLFTPGNHSRRVEKVFSVGADAAILDLEDAVATAEKPATRGMIVEALGRPRSCLAYVRVNALDTQFCYDDLVEVVVPGLDGIVLPKVESAAGLMTIEWLLRQLERNAGLPEGGIDLMPIIETAAGLMAAEEIARAGSRARRLAFGAGDFTFDVNITWTADEQELAYSRSRLVAISRAAGLEAPIDSVWVDLQDISGLRTSADQVLKMGYQGKMCIHPTQVSVVNEVFTPSEETVAFAKRVVDAFEAAEAAGSAALQVDGKFIDYPIVYRAQRVLRLMETINAQTSRVA
jgi:citrate lyase subunit beta/citryl-CoA lyase